MIRIPPVADIAVRDDGNFLSGTVRVGSPQVRWQAPGEGRAASEGTGDRISRAGTNVLLVTQPVRYCTVRVLLHTVCINT